MNFTHIHLLLNHAPIIGIMGAFVLCIWLIFKPNMSLWRLSLIVTVACGLLLLPVFFTGEPAEDTVESIVGVQESMIESHEDSAKLSLILVLASAVVAVFFLIRTKMSQELKRLDLVIVTLVLFTSSASLSWTGYLGGQIRHTEISSVAAQQGGASEGTEKDDDDAPAANPATNAQATKDSTTAGASATVGAAQAKPAPKAKDDDD